MFIGGDAATFAAVYKNISMVLIYAHTQKYKCIHRNTHTHYAIYAYINKHIFCVRELNHTYHNDHETLDDASDVEERRR